MLIGQLVFMIGDQHLASVVLLVETRCHGETRNKAMSQGLCEILWVRNILSELKVLRNGSAKLQYDNISAINIANNPVQRDKTKHVKIDLFFYQGEDIYWYYCVESREVLRNIVCNRPMGLQPISYVGMYIFYVMEREE